MGEFNQAAAEKFLEEGGGYFDENKADQFLSGQIEITPVEKRPVEEQASMGRLGNIGSGLNDQILGLLGIPGDLANWASSKAGLEANFAGKESFRRIGSKLDIGTEVGKEPDTALYKAGEFTVLGLEFLAPFLKWGRAAQTASMTQQVGGKLVEKGTGKLVAEKVSLPFFEAPKASMALEGVSSITAGIGAYYGGKEYGPIGELVGGFTGILPSALTTTGPYAFRYGQKRLFPYTKEGGKAKGGQIMRDIAETPAEEVSGKITAEAQKVLPDADITPAKLSGDRHLQALEAQLAKEDPKLYHQLRLQEEETRRLALQELKGMRGAGRIEELQANLGSRIQYFNALISSRIDRAMVKAKTAIDKIKSGADRTAQNKLASQELHEALDDARVQEKVEWGKVNEREMSDTSELFGVYQAHLLERAQAKSSDPSDIPSFVATFLGKLDKKGELKVPENGYKAQETIKELTTFRSRLGNEIATEKAKDAPNWNKVRIMGDLSESILKDIESSSTTGAVNNAIAFSRTMHQKFDNGYVGMVLGNERTGTAFTPELTLESLGAKGKGAVAIKEMLAASPESSGTIESYLKLNLARSSVINKTGDKAGTLNVARAKEYMADNAETLKMFPDLKNSLDDAIAVAEKSASSIKILKGREKAISQASAEKLSKVKPKRVLSAILDSPYPEKEIAKVMKQSGMREVLKDDIIDFLLGKSYTSKFDIETGSQIMSGNKLRSAWDSNKKVFSKALTKDELDRIEIITNTLFRNEKLDNLPSVEAMLEPNPNWLLRMVLTTAGARAGAKLGEGTSGASLKTASAISNLFNKTLGKLDIGTAKRLIKESIRDRELFNALMADTTKMPEFNKSIRTLQGWMAADVINHLEATNQSTSP